MFREIVFGGGGPCKVCLEVVATGPNRHFDWALGAEHTLPWPAARPSTHSITVCGSASPAQLLHHLCFFFFADFYLTEHKTEHVRTT